jgi:hypothetical protein
MHDYFIGYEIAVKPGIVTFSERLGVGDLPARYAASFETGQVRLALFSQRGSYTLGSVSMSRSTSVAVSD